MKVIFKNFALLVWVILSVILLSFGTDAASNVSSCQPIFLSGEYSLDNDIDYGGELIDCFVIMADDVTFDCSSFVITGENMINGILINETSNVTVKNCVIEGLDYGIVIKEGSGNILIDNDLNSNIYGVRIQNSSDNVLTGNLINDNQESGILLVSSSDNHIYNNFFVNSKNFQITGAYGLNSWNNSIYGNYWAHPNNTGYSLSCLDLNSDYICDSTYKLKINNTDYFPLKNCSICPIYNVEESRGGISKEEDNKIYYFNMNKLSTKHTVSYSQGDSLNMNLNDENHTMAVNKIREGLVEVNVSSVLQQAILFVGEPKKFSLTLNWYNLSITLNSVQGSGDSAKANITVMSISEPIQTNEEIISEVNTCIESWECGEWGDCLYGKQTRNCIDLNNCGTEENKYLTEQSCEKSVNWFLEALYIFIVVSIILLIVFLIRWGRLK